MCELVVWLHTVYNENERKHKGVLYISTEIRVIDETGTQLGVMEKQKAYELANQRALDLVLINGKTNPQVFKIMDGDKHRFEEQKREKAHKAKQREQIVVLKEIRLNPSIGAHDLSVKLNKMTAFLRKGNKVRVSVFFKGRMITNKSVGESLLQSVIERMQDVAQPTAKPKMEGKKLIVDFMATGLK